jgi:DNA-binding PadR family transcriptional regulator
MYGPRIETGPARIRMKPTISEAAVAALLPLHTRDFHILLTLLDGDCHGYGVVKAIERRTGGELILDPANLYRALQRLKKSGLVCDSEAPAAVAADEDGRTRRYHGLTDLGRTTLDAEAQRMRALADAVQARTGIASSENS